MLPKKKISVFFTCFFFSQSLFAGPMIIASVMAAHKARKNQVRGCSPHRLQERNAYVIKRFHEDFDALLQAQSRFKNQIDKLFSEKEEWISSKTLKSIRKKYQKRDDRKKNNWRLQLRTQTRNLVPF